MTGFPGSSSSLTEHWSLPLYARLTVAYVIFYTALKIAFIFSGYDLFTEEAQYWVWSRHPDWSYYSKPPMIAWVNFATRFFGHHDIVLRFTALAFGLGTLYIVYRVAWVLFEEASIACLAVVMMSVSPYFLLASTFLTTDSLLYFFWALTGYFFVRGVGLNSMRDWMAAGLFFGLGMLSKYTMLFFLFALTPLWLLPYWRKYIPGLAVFLGVGLVMFAPVILWNYEHDWVTFRHVSALAHGTKATGSLRASLSHIVEFAGGVLLVNAPFLLVLLFQGRRMFRKSPEAAKIRWLLVPVVATVSVFLFLSVFKRTEVNWPGMSYLSMPIVLAWIAHRAGIGKSAVRLSAVTLAVIMFFLFPRVVDRIGLAPLLPLKIDSMKRMAGWKELSANVAEVMTRYPLAGLIVTDSYHVASELSFYGGFEDILCVNAGRRMNQFDIWRQVQPDKRGRFPVVLYVTEFGSPPAEVVRYERLESTFSVPVTYRGSVIRTFHIFVLEGFNAGPATEFDTF